MRLLQAPHLRLTAAGIALLFAFSAVYLAAFNTPRPHDVRVAVVGGPSALREARATVDPRRFYAVPYDSEQAAREALLEDRVRGILTLERGAATVTVASAYGMPAAQAVEQGLTAVADQAGVAVRVVDARPLPEHDAR